MEMDVKIKQKKVGFLEKVIQMDLKQNKNFIKMEKTNLKVFKLEMIKGKEKSMIKMEKMKKKERKRRKI